MGDIRCDNCQRLISYLEHYMVDEKEGRPVRYCADCSVEKGFAHYRQEKKERMLTFFPETPEAPEVPQERQ